MDALTGQDLNRWFPLTAAAEYLYFLPPRRGVDSAKKLRLIASAGWAGERRGSLRERLMAGMGEGHGVEVGGEEEGDAADDGGERDGHGDGRGDSDHFQARPLSDGYHILFTDPTTGTLCLGSDAPLGGPTKLLRKMIFHGPRDGAVPTVYAAGTDLRWGVRVAVGYGERLWVFSVPPDVFGSGPFRAGCGAESPRPELWGEALREEEQDSEGAWSGKWPVRVRGVEVGSVTGLVDVAVEAEPGRFTVWAFSAAGEVFAWQVDGGREAGVCERVVGRDGEVIDVRDADGDVVMRDAPDVLIPELRVGGRAVGYDGAASMFLKAAKGLGALSGDGSGISTCAWVERVVHGGRDVDVRDGDSGYGSDDEGFEQGGGAFMVEISGRESEQLVSDFLERGDVDEEGLFDGSGMVRMELEVL